MHVWGGGGGGRRRLTRAGAAQGAIASSVFLPRLRRMASGCATGLSVIPAHRLAAVRACLLDPAVSLVGMLRLPRGGGAAGALM